MFSTKETALTSLNKILVTKQGVSTAKQNANQQNDEPERWRTGVFPVVRPADHGTCHAGTKTSCYQHAPASIALTTAGGDGTARKAGVSLITDGQPQKKRKLPHGSSALGLTGKVKTAESSSTSQGIAQDSSKPKRPKRSRKTKWNVEPGLSVLRKAIYLYRTGLGNSVQIERLLKVPARTLRRYVNESMDPHNKMFYIPETPHERHGRELREAGERYGVYSSKSFHVAMAFTTTKLSDSAAKVAAAAYDDSHVLQTQDRTGGDIAIHAATKPAESVVPTVSVAAVQKPGKNDTLSSVASTSASLPQLPPLSLPSLSLPSVDGDGDAASASTSCGPSTELPTAHQLSWDSSLGDENSWDQVLLEMQMDPELDFLGMRDSDCHDELLSLPLEPSLSDLDCLGLDFDTENAKARIQTIEAVKAKV